MTGRFFLAEQPVIETERLLIRAIRDSDSPGMLAMDRDPDVHRYLDDPPIETEDEAQRIIDNIRGQYATVGIGRWAVENRRTGQFLGWTGFKWIDEDEGGERDYLDIGYRLRQSAWGSGYATEAARACLDFAASNPELGGSRVCGLAHAENQASRRVLEKLGLSHTGSFVEFGEPVDFFEFVSPE